ncbi:MULTISPECIES: helix-turn-helix domain-containing protein [Mumia]|uniref:Helix-turn-helix domain-containing protein n=1 Tax=Mumia xiangluensis TaxID=1678900 RepID=A0ABW1QM62_9ACTN|nr:MULTISPECIES: XRE family transcriptional regulator [Mumia]
MPGTHGATASSADTSLRVGARVRRLREDRGLSLSALARAAGIGKASLSELEAGRRNATLSTLYALAAPLGVPLAALLDEAVGAEVSGGGVTARLLDVRHHPDSTVETYVMHFAAGEVRHSPSHGAGVREHLVVVRGALQLGPDTQPCEAVAGEHVAFDADVPHHYAALGDEPAEGILVIVTPAGIPSRDRSDPP